MSRFSNVAAGVAFGGVTAAVALSGSQATRKSVDGWYTRLRKPPFQPPPGLFGPVWTALYASSAIAGWRVWRAPSSPQRTRALALWTAQLGFNALWSPLFFGHRRMRLALADCAALAVTVAAFRRAARPVDTLAAKLVTPYVAWTRFATLLNEEAVRLN